MHLDALAHQLAAISIFTLVEYVTLLLEMPYEVMPTPSAQGSSDPPFKRYRVSAILFQLLARFVKNITRSLDAPQHCPTMTEVSQNMLFFVPNTVLVLFYSIRCAFIQCQPLHAPQSISPVRPLSYPIHNSTCIFFSGYRPSCMRRSILHPVPPPSSSNTPILGSHNPDPS
jgi:hypothetical protein